MFLRFWNKKNFGKFRFKKKSKDSMSNAMFLHKRKQHFKSEKKL